jgi:hypothetical protein
MSLRLRSRIVYVALALGTIVVGLAVHLHGAALSPVARDVLGDALWAAMIAWWVGAAAPTARLSRRAVMALAICFAVELSQLYHAPGIDALRETTLGHLVLGSGFDPRDFVSYAVGVLAAALLELVMVRRSAGTPAGQRAGAS